MPSTCQTMPWLWAATPGCGPKEFLMHLALWSSRSCFHSRAFAICLSKGMSPFLDTTTTATLDCDFTGPQVKMIVITSVFFDWWTGVLRTDKRGETQIRSYSTVRCTAPYNGNHVMYGLIGRWLENVMAGGFVCVHKTCQHVAFRWWKRFLRT